MPAPNHHVPLKPYKTKFKVDDEVLIQVETMAACGLSLREIAGYYGITKQALHSRGKIIPRLQIALDKGHAKMVNRCGQVVIGAVQNKDVKAALGWLAVHADAWRPQNVQRVNVSGQVEHQVTGEVNHQGQVTLSDEIMDRLAINRVKQRALKVVS